MLNSLNTLNFKKEDQFNNIIPFQAKKESLSLENKEYCEKQSDDVINSYKAYYGFLGLKLVNQKEDIYNLEIKGKIERILFNFYSVLLKNFSFKELEFLGFNDYIKDCLNENEESFSSINEKEKVFLNSKEIPEPIKNFVLLIKEARYKIKGLIKLD
jgi:hypothetical protein